MAQVKPEPGASTADTATAGPSYPTASMRTLTLPSLPTLPPPFGPSSAYGQTSQARNWRFSRSRLSLLRSEINTAARQSLPSSSSTDGLSVDDELALIAYYLVKVGQIVHALKLPELVEATATTYVKRFYLRNSCMNFHPKNIVITCIFLASKAENYPLNLSDFARKLAGKQASDAKVVEEYRRIVFDLEFLVSQSLLFEYAVTGAHRALYGLLLDIQSGEVGREELHKLAAESHGKLASSRWTDAEFVYSPSQIALACLRACEPRGRQVLGAWLDAKEAAARTAGLAAKKQREKLREQEAARAAKAKIALARRTKGKAGAKAAEDELASSANQPAESVEFDDSLLEQQPLGMSRTELEAVLDEVEDMISKREQGGYTGGGKGSEDLERIKEIDVRQKRCMTLMQEGKNEDEAGKKRELDDEQVKAEEGGKRAKKSDVGFDDDD